MYTSGVDFIKDLISTYDVVLEIIKIHGDSGIVNRKRQETYKRALDLVKEIDTGLEATKRSLDEIIEELETGLTSKPKILMKELLKNGEVVLEDKSPYNGAVIKNGKLIGSEKDQLDAFKNLSVLSGIGIGLGDSGVKELVNMGYNSVAQLKTEYEKDKFANFRKGLQGPLRKYFEGTVRIEKMTREEASKWEATISKIVDEAIEEVVDEDKKPGIKEGTKAGTTIKHKMAGSYARKQEEIGDIDYLVVVNDKKDPNKANEVLYEIMTCVLDKLTEVTNLCEDFPVELDSVTETPSKAIKGKRYSTAVKMWFKVKTLKTKIEIYGYSNTEFIFPYFARAGEVNLQKKVKLHALKKGYKLSPWSLDIKDTDISIENIPEQVELIKERLGKPNIETIRELFKFLDYSTG